MNLPYAVADLYCADEPLDPMVASCRKLKQNTILMLPPCDCDDERLRCSMTDICKFTGELIGREESIKQGIDTLLTTPKGTRVMRADIGLASLETNGEPKPSLKAEEIETDAREALQRYEPRISVVEVRAHLTDEGALEKILVTYADVDVPGKHHSITVSYPERGTQE